jgi:hypothetical protein
VLRALLRDNAQKQHGVLRADVVAFAGRFEAEYGFALAFDDGAVDALIEQSLAADKTIRALCEEKFRNFHHGLKLLVNEDGGVDAKRFTITREVVENPDKAISRWVVERFKKAG